MSTRRLIAISVVPIEIKKAFRLADPPKTGEEALWRERAARMTLDALGHTNMTVRPSQHNETVRYARRWFRLFYEDHPDPKLVDNAVATFDDAGIVFDRVRNAVLASEPILYEADADTDVDAVDEP